MPNISRNKGNLTMKFGQLIEYNMRNIFLKKILYKMWWRNYSQTLFSKFEIELISGSIVQNFIKSVFIVCQVGGHLDIIETKLQTSCFHLIYSFFMKQERGLGLVSLCHFLHDLWGKIFLLLHSINWPNFNVWLPLLREILCNMCIVIAC